MFGVYIKNYKSGSNIITDWTLVYEIPGLVHDILLAPTVAQEIGKADTFEFQMNVGCPYYNSLLQLKTLFRVDYEEDTIFYGRVLTVDVSDNYGTKRVHCEGALAFLNDVPYPGKSDKKREKITGEAFLKKLLTYYNSKCDSYKEIKRGQIPGHYNTSDDDDDPDYDPYACGTITDEQKIDLSEEKKYGSTGWTPLLSSLNTLQSQYGGYVRVRYQNGTNYLDWFANYFSPLQNTHQSIEVGVNLLEVSSQLEVSNIFTVLIPMGKSNSGGDPLYLGMEASERAADDPFNNGGDSPTPPTPPESPETPATPNPTNVGNHNTISDYDPGWQRTYPNAITVPEILNVYTHEELTKGYMSWTDYRDAISNFGLVFKTMSFDNATTQEKLFEYATDYIKNNYKGSICSMTVKAIDLHMLSEYTNSIPKIMLGDQVNVIYMDNGDRVEKLLTCKNVKYDLQSPENTSYTLGVPSEILDHEYGQAKNGGGGGGRKPQSEEKKDEETIESVVDLWSRIEGTIHDTYGTDALDTWHKEGVPSMTFTTGIPHETFTGISFGSFTDPVTGITYGIAVNAAGTFTYDLETNVKIKTLESFENGRVKLDIADMKELNATDNITVGDVSVIIGATKTDTGLLFTRADGTTIPITL